LSRRLLEVAIVLSSVAGIAFMQDRTAYRRGATPKSAATSITAPGTATPGLEKSDQAILLPGLPFSEVSVDGVNIGMTESQVRQAWGECGLGRWREGGPFAGRTGIMLNRLRNGQSLDQCASFDPGARVHGVFGPNLRIRQHDYGQTSDPESLKSILGQPRIWRWETHETWSFQDGCVQVHVCYTNDLRRISSFEVQNLIRLTPETSDNLRASPTPP